MDKKQQIDRKDLIFKLRKECLMMIFRGEKFNGKEFIGLFDLLGEKGEVDFTGAKESLKIAETVLECRGIVDFVDRMCREHPDRVDLAIRKHVEKIRKEMVERIGLGENTGGEIEEKIRKLVEEILDIGSKAEFVAAFQSSSSSSSSPPESKSKSKSNRRENEREAIGEVYRRITSRNKNVIWKFGKRDIDWAALHDFRIGDQTDRRITQLFRFLQEDEDPQEFPGWKIAFFPISHIAYTIDSANLSEFNNLGEVGEFGKFKESKYSGFQGLPSNSILTAVLVGWIEDRMLEHLDLPSGFISGQTTVSIPQLHSLRHGAVLCDELVIENWRYEGEIEWNSWQKGRWVVEGGDGPENSPNPIALRVESDPYRCRLDWEETKESIQQKVKKLELEGKLFVHEGTDCFDENTRKKWGN